jgi:hypothetical protein
MIFRNCDNLGHLVELKAREEETVMISSKVQTPLSMGVFDTLAISKSPFC